VRERNEPEQGWGNALPEGRQEAKAAEAKWRGKGFTLPSLTNYRSGGATLPRTLRVAHINCRQHRLPLTSEPHHAKTAGCACMHDHYGVATEGPWHPITSAPTSPTTPAAAPPEKMRLLQTTAATIAAI
jgi:hypothetical protein